MLHLQTPRSLCCHSNTIRRDTGSGANTKLSQRRLRAHYASLVQSISLIPRSENKTKGRQYTDRRENEFRQNTGRRFLF